MAAGYEVLGQQQPVADGLFKLVQLKQQQQERQDNLQEKQREFDFRQQEQRDNRFTSTAKYLNDNFGYDQFKTGIPGVDNIVSKKLPQIFNEAVNIGMNGNPADAINYAQAQTANIAALHNAALQKVAQEKQSIAQLVRQNPNIDESRLTTDVMNRLNGAFTTNNGSDLIDPGSLTNGLFNSNIAASLAGSGQYALSAQPLYDAIAKQKVTPVTESSFNERGGGDEITFYPDQFHDIAPYLGSGKFKTDNPKNVITHKEDIPVNPNDPNSRVISVLPSNDMEYLESSPSVRSGLDYLYHTEIGNPKSPLYTDQSSPLYGMTPNDQQLHPYNIDLARRWIARDAVSKFSPSRASAKSKEDRISIVNVNAGKNTNTPYYDYGTEIENKVPKNRDAVLPLSEISGAAQNAIYKNFGITHSEYDPYSLGIKYNPNTGKNELYYMTQAKGGKNFHLENKLGDLDNTQINLSSAHTEKERKSILTGNNSDSNAQNNKSHAMEKGKTATDYGL